MSFGGEINKLKLYEFWPGNNGLVATENIAKGELLVYIPREMLITREDV